MEQNRSEAYKALYAEVLEGFQLRFDLGVVFNSKTVYKDYRGKTSKPPGYTEEKYLQFVEEVYRQVIKDLDGEVISFSLEDGYYPKFKCVFHTEHTQIPNILASRYSAMLNQKGFVLSNEELLPREGDETSEFHLLWMLNEIFFNKEQSLTKKHRWIGYIQAILVSKGYTTVMEEREATRDILSGA